MELIKVETDIDGHYFTIMRSFKKTKYTERFWITNYILLDSKYDYMLSIIFDWFEDELKRKLHMGMGVLL